MSDFEKNINELVQTAMNCFADALERAAVPSQPTTDPTVAELKATIERLKKDNMALNSANIALNAQVNGLKNGNADMARHINTLNSRLTDAKATIKDLGTRLDAVARTDSSATIRQLNATIAQRDRRIEILLKDNAALKRMKHYNTPEYNKLRKDYTAACNQRDSFRVERDKLKGEIERIRKDCMAAQTELAEYKKTMVPPSTERILVGSVTWTAEEVAKMRDYNIDLLQRCQDADSKSAKENGVVWVDRQPYTRERVMALLAETRAIKAQLEDIAKNSSTILIDGKYWTINQVVAMHHELKRLRSTHKATAANLQDLRAKHARVAVDYNRIRREHAFLTNKLKDYQTLLNAHGIQDTVECPITNSSVDRNGVLRVTTYFGDQPVCPETIAMLDAEVNRLSKLFTAIQKLTR